MNGSGIVPGPLMVRSTGIPRDWMLGFVSRS